MSPNRINTHSHTHTYTGNNTILVARVEASTRRHNVKKIKRVDNVLLGKTSNTSHIICFERSRKKNSKRLYIANLSDRHIPVEFFEVVVVV